MNNLPTYRYSMEVNVAVVAKRGICHEAKPKDPWTVSPFYAKMTIITHQPIRKGDVLDPSCCFADDVVEAFVRFYLFDEPTEDFDVNEEDVDKSENIFDKYDTRLRLVACKVDRLQLVYNQEEDGFQGFGDCTLFAYLEPFKDYKSLKELDNAPITSINTELKATLYAKVIEKSESTFWEAYIPRWSDKFYLTGNVKDILDK